MVKVELLLHAAARNPEGVEAVAAWCAAHGLTVTGTGIAAVTALASEDILRDCFGDPPPGRGQPSSALKGWDAHELKVPDGLRDLVAGVFVPAQHQRHGDGGR